MEKMKTITMAMVLMMGMATTGCVSTRDTVRINQVELGMDKSDIHQGVLSATRRRAVDAIRLDCCQHDSKEQNGRGQFLRHSLSGRP